MKCFWFVLVLHAAEHSGELAMIAESSKLRPFHLVHANSLTGPFGFSFFKLFFLFQDGCHSSGTMVLVAFKFVRTCVCDFGFLFLAQSSGIPAGRLVPTKLIFSCFLRSHPRRSGPTFLTNFKMLLTYDQGIYNPHKCYIS